MTTIAAGQACVSGIRIRFGTFKRQNASTLHLALTRVESKQAKSAAIETAGLVDNALVTLRFAAFDNTQGEAFTLSIRSTAEPDTCVAVFVGPDGDLEMQLVYGELVLAETSVVLPSDLIVQTIDARSTRSTPGDGMTYALTHWWVDRFGIYVEGSLTLGHPTAIGSVRLSSGDAMSPLSFEPVAESRTARFSGYLACRPGEPFHLHADTTRGTISTRLVLPDEPLPHPPSPDLFVKFIDLVNREKHSVLEVGSRKSSPFSVSNRPHFSPHVRFVGFDILPGENTDVVGDAHHLTRHFPEQSLGAAYSLTVLEHLLMPWVFALELNRVLEMDGLVYHATHQTWPVHAAPNDFYRFSDEALKFLFGADSGFEVIAAHMEHLVWLYPEHRTSQAYHHTPLFPGYGNSQVLARKIRHVALSDAVWEITAERLIERSRRYPLCEAD